MFYVWPGFHEHCKTNWNLHINPSEIWKWYISWIISSLLYLVPVCVYFNMHTWPRPWTLTPSFFSWQKQRHHHLCPTSIFVKEKVHVLESTLKNESVRLTWNIYSLLFLDISHCSFSCKQPTSQPDHPAASPNWKSVSTLIRCALLQIEFGAKKHIRVGVW